MTLLMHLAVKTNIDYAIVTADTRSIYAIYNKLTGERTDQKQILEDRTDKAGLLTDKVIYSAGGLMEYSLEIVELIKEEIKPHCDLDDCRSVFKRIAEEYVQDYNGTVQDKMFSNSADSFAVYLTGFKKDGTTGIILYSPVTGLEEASATDFVMFAPNEDIYNMQDGLFNPETMQTAENEVQGWINHLAKVHGAISYLEPDSVSPDCLYHILIKDENGEVKYIQNTYDASDLHEQLPDREVLKQTLLESK